MTTIKFAGEFGQCDAMMIEPWGVDMRDGVIAVVDAELCRVQRFDANGQLLNVWSHAGNAPGELQSPRDVALGPAGEVYVADTVNSRIQAFAPDGSLLWARGQQGSAPGNYSFPQGITFWSDKALIVVADTHNNRIQMLDQQGDLQHHFSIAPALHHPKGLAIDGELFIADDRNREVKVADLGGTFARRWDIIPVTPIPWSTSPGTDPGPTGMTVMGDRVFVSDLRNSEIHESDRNGAVVATHGGPGVFAGPAGLANDGKRLAVCDSGNHQVVLTDFAGHWEEIGSRRSRQNNGCLIAPLHLVVHPGSQQVFVVDSGNQRIQGFTLGGRPTIAFSRPGMRAPFGIAVHGDELFVTDNTAALPRVFVYDPNGNFIRRIDIWFQPGAGGPGYGVAQGIAIDPSGNSMFIALASRNLMLEVDLTGLCHQFWDMSATAIHQNTVHSGGIVQGNSPTDVAITPNGGNIVVADPNSMSGVAARLWVGNFKDVANVAPIAHSSFNGTNAIAVDETRNLVYVVANAGLYVVDLNATGSAMITQHLSAGSAPGQLQGAGGVALTPDGKQLYISEYGNHRVQAFDISP